MTCEHDYSPTPISTHILIGGTPVDGESRNTYSRRCKKCGMSELYAKSRDDLVARGVILNRDTIFKSAGASPGGRLGDKLAVIPQPAPIVYVVICIDPKTHRETTHMFSSEEKRQAWADKDPRNKVFYDYLLDDPDHHEKPLPRQN